MPFVVQAVLLRELRAESRLPLNCWLRIGGVAAMAAVFLAVVYGQQFTGKTVGIKLFAGLNLALFCGIWIVAPLLVADCISRERREGTLGLLFLTPLTAGSIVAGKSLIHALRAAALFLAVCPVLTLPFLLGGVSWKDAAMAVLINSSALLLALAAGLLASSLAAEWLRALALALVFSAGLALLFCLAFYLGSVAVFAEQWRPGSRPAYAYLLKFLWMDSASNAAGLLFGFASDPGESVRVLAHEAPRGLRGLGSATWTSVWATFPAKGQAAWFAWAAEMAAYSALFLGAAMGLAAWQVRRSWRDEPPSARRQRVAKVLAAPVVKRSFLRSRMSRKLDRNPIGWLHQYSLGARLMQWGWCLGFVIVECLLVTDADLSSLWAGQYWMAYALLLSMAFSAAGSFRREQQSGAMELLLVTPLKESQIIIGRLWGIWSQFLPSTVILALAWLQLSQNARLFARISSSHLSAWSEIVFPVFFLGAYATLPAVGLYFSMRRMNFLMAWLLTLMPGVLLPLPIYWIGITRWELPGIVNGIMGAQTAAALVCLTLLYRNLKARRFALSAV